MERPDNKKEILRARGKEGCVSVLMMSFLFLPYLVVAEDYESFRSGLEVNYENMKSSVAFYEVPAIYSAQSTGNYFLVRRNSELERAGEGFLAYLQDYYGVYGGLDFDAWLEASYALLAIDDWVSKGVGWGNLVIKINICNYIVHTMFDLLQDRRDELNEDKLAKLLALQKTLRKHVPSTLAIYGIALRHYGYLNKLNPIPFQYSFPIFEEDKQIKKYFEDEFGATSVIEEKSKGALKQEYAVDVYSYLYLYNRPIPWALGIANQYPDLLWSMYLYTLVLQKQGLGFRDWTSLSQEEVSVLLKRLHAGEDRNWMPSTLFTDSQESVEHYIGTVLLNGRLLERLERFRRLRSNETTKKKCFRYTSYLDEKTCMSRAIVV